MAWPFARLMQIVKSAHSSGSEPSSGFRHRRHKYTHSADTASVEFKVADSGECRSAFRTDVDHRSEVMSISVPN